MMKYLYYTLFLFYVKIIKLHKQYPPIINITAVMSFLITALCTSVANAYQYDIGNNFPIFNTIILIVGSFILYKLLYDYYKSREDKLLEEMNGKPLWKKIIMISISVVFIFLVVKLWMFDGMNEVYQYIKSVLHSN